MLSSIFYSNGAALVTITASAATIRTKSNATINENITDCLSNKLFLSLKFLPNNLVTAKARNSLCLKTTEWSQAVASEDFRSVRGPPLARYGM